jgi:aerobic-type carbon monoxide dehydrogenase small subunit (CoxS/CutS family)
MQRPHRARRVPVRLLHSRADLSAVKLIEEGNAGTDVDTREFMSGNICRCAAYPDIRAAIRQVREPARGAA